MATETERGVEVMVREPTVQREVEALHQLGQRFDGLLERLTMRLEPVLRPSWETPKKDRATTDCPLASMIANGTDHLERLVDDLEQLVERVDL